MGILDTLSANKSALLGLSAGLTGYGHPGVNFGRGVNAAIQGQAEDRLRKKQAYEMMLAEQERAREEALRGQLAEYGRGLTRGPEFQPASDILGNIDTSALEWEGFDNTPVLDVSRPGSMHHLKGLYENPDFIMSQMEEGGLPGMGEGGIGLGKPAESEIQKSIISTDNMLRRMEKIGTIFKPRDFTYAGQADAWLGSQQAKITGDAPEHVKREVARRRQLYNAVEQVFNDYRREITGAAASVTELNKLKEAIVNMDLSPVDFQASYNLFLDDLRRKRRDHIATLRGGLPQSEQYSTPDLDELDNPVFQGAPGPFSRAAGWLFGGGGAAEESDIIEYDSQGNRVR